jgi:hypothetical protein
MQSKVKHHPQESFSSLNDVQTFSAPALSAALQNFQAASPKVIIFTDHHTSEV